MVFRGIGASQSATTTGSPTTAVLDSAHEGDIVGALGRIGREETGAGRRRWQRLRLLLVIMGPGLIVMVGDNDAGGVATYTQAGQNYGMGLLWTLVLLIPVLYVNQEMVARLGAVTGVGHARLIFKRFGKFWGAFSFGDLLMLNTLTIIVDFIGAAMALGFLGCPKVVAIPVAAVVLLAVIASGSFRRWERLMFVLIAANLLVIPMALMVRPRLAASVSGLVPQFPGGLDSTLLLLVVAIVGTTVAPWQLFFQQSNVVDKRITPRWIRYERIDLCIGIAIVMVGAAALMSATAFGFAGTPATGQFSDAGAVAANLATYVGHPVAVLFAVVLLNASLVGANAVGLATTYAIGDVFGARHSLHWRPSQAPVFYGAYAALMAVAAVVAFAPDHVLGLITQGVQALAGVLLPSATVFLVLLCNDRAVLGPWVNSTRQNIVAWTIVWCLVLLSLALTAATFFSSLSTSALVSGLAGGAAVGVLGGAATLVTTRRAAARRDARLAAAAFRSPDPGAVDELDAEQALSRGEHLAARDQARQVWRMPPLASLQRPVMSTPRRLGLLMLRVYLLIAAAFVVVKVVEIGIGS